MNIVEIYKKYQIMPSLQLHMLRVAGVSNIICDSLSYKIDSQSVISACLLHDMGNILKFNLDIFPDFLEPQGKDYWQNIKNEYEQKYGSDEHEATIQIARELGVSDRVIELINAFKFSFADENYASEDVEKKISTYSDMRVEPRKVVSLEERVADGRRRFKLNKKHLQEKEEFFNKMVHNLKKIETQIFQHSSLTPEEITDEKVTILIPNLRQFELYVHKR